MYKTVIMIKNSYIYESGSFTEESSWRDDSGSLCDDDSDAGLEEGHSEVDDRLALRVDLQRRQDHVRVLRHELVHKPIPFSVLE